MDKLLSFLSCFVYAGLKFAKFFFDIFADRGLFEIYQNTIVKKGSLQSSELKKLISEVHI